VNDVKRLFFYLLAGVVSTFAFASNAPSTCSETGSSNKIWMDQKYDPFGFCVHMALRAIVHQYRCDSDPSNCVLPSVLDLVSANFLTFHKNPGQDSVAPQTWNNPVAVLNVLASKKNLQDEQCSPIEKFLPQTQVRIQKIGQDRLTPLTFEEHRRALLEDFKEPCHDPTPNPWEIQAISNLLATEILHKANMKFYENVVGYVHSKKCQERSVPSFKVKTFDADPESLKDRLKKGQSVMLGLRVPDAPGSNQLGNHAIAVTNSRTQCCGKTCWTKYHVLDSLGFYWARTERDGWISEEDLFKYLDPNMKTGIYIEKNN